AAWEVLTRSGLISTKVMPTFSSVGAAAVDLVVSGTLGHHLVVSLYRALGGLALSLVVGVLLGFAMATSRQAERFFDPIVSLLYPLPQTALVPLTLVWLRVTAKAGAPRIFLPAPPPAR